jgi:CubicO group peptidase (beta-lactamase class C family)
LVNVYSVGKAVVSTLVLQLVDEGSIGLDDPVSRHWPEFGAAGKERGTVRQLLCHRIGVPALAEPLTNDDLFDFGTMTAAVARAEPWWEPGARHAYHTNTFGHLTGGLLMAVTGSGPGDRLTSHLAGPLGADIHFGLDPVDLDRCADLIWAGPELRATFDELDGFEGDTRMTMLGYANPPGYSSIGVVNTESWRRAEIPSTNGHATARGVAAVYDGLLDGRVLSDDLLAEATTAQSSGWCPVLEQDVTFGLGFQPWTQQRPLGRTPGGYGHFGTGGALGFADPSRRIAFGYVMNHVIPRWQSPRNRALVDAVYAALG